MFNHTLIASQKQTRACSTNSRSDRSTLRAQMLQALLTLNNATAGAGLHSPGAPSLFGRPVESSMTARWTGAPSAKINNLMMCVDIDMLLLFCSDQA